jgi:GTP 3',8-cyclase
MNIPISLADQPGKRALIDGFFRAVTYLRVSVTDRCDLRCLYCMSPDMTFLPKKDLLTLGELDRICSVFIARGVRKLRLTGGEPLMRRGFLDLVRGLSRHLKSGDLQELTLTTNGTQLSRYAADLAAAGVRRINVSLDTLDSRAFRETTRGGDITKVLEGIEAARKAGLKVKINTVALRGINETSLDLLVEWAHAGGMDITLVETMPLGDTGEDRTDRYVPLSLVRSQFEKRYTLVELSDSTGGPARYVRIVETGGRVGFITPLTHILRDMQSGRGIVRRDTLHVSWKGRPGGPATGGPGDFIGCAVERSD